MQAKAARLFAPLKTYPADLGFQNPKLEYFTFHFVSPIWVMCHLFRLDSMFIHYYLIR